MAHVDNISTVSANNQDGPFPGVASHTASDIDILQKIWELYREHQCANAEWVEAHQDTKYPTQILPPDAQLNCKVDADASTYMDAGQFTATTLPVFYLQQQH
eukprot:15087267-Ditylum_brightwellii.AAC.1